MNKKILSIMCLLSMITITACGEDENSSSSSANSINNTNSVVSSENGNNNSSSSVINNSSSSSSTSSSSGTNDGVVIDDEEQYIVESGNRIDITLNVTLPDSENDVYVIGDFNNWGKFNTLNDESYKVIDGTISISNVEEGKEYSYMYVQKIKGATYTYNFGLNTVDSENNPIIGYTKSGELISQYCISQKDLKFTITATNGFVFNDVVNEWKEPIYGDTIEVSDPNKSTEVPTSGYNLCIKEYGNETLYYIPLENTGTMDFEGRAQYVAYNVTLEAKTAITLYDGNTNTPWVEDTLEPYGAHQSFAVSANSGIVCIAEGNFDIYVKLQSGNDTIYICNAGEVNDSLPMSGYSLFVTDKEGEVRYINLTPIGEKDNQGRDQYFGDDIQLNEGDVFKLYDNKNGISWVEKVLEPYGQYANFEVTDEGIKCNVSGIYDIYAKFAWEDNTIYIGNEAGA